MKNADLLEPQELRAFAIAHIDQFDLYLSLHNIPAFGYVEEPEVDETGTELTEDPYPGNWKSFVSIYEDLFATVTEGWPSGDNRFEQADYWLLAKQGTVTGATKHILALYEHMRGGSPDVPLYQQYASLDIRPVEPCLPSNAAFASRLGHASDQFALAPAQRDALTHLLAMQQGEILAVNGPPGTGKTTLLLSVVASQWAQAALDQADPPVILAASSNNQAVTNIIDAFGKDFAHGSGPFTGRWLPDLKSFGSYFPAFGKEDEQSKTYQTRSFFDTVESKGYIEHAKQAYLAAARQAFPGLHELTIDSAIKELHKALAEKVAKLTAIESSLQRFRQANIALAKELGDVPEETLAQRRTQLETVESQKSAYDAMVDCWEHFRAKESILYTLFSWIPAIAEKRLRLAKLALKPLLTTPELSDQWRKIDDIDAAMSAITAEWRQRLGEHQQLVATGEAVLAERETAKEALANTLRVQAEEANVKLDSIDEIDAFADMHIRFPIFLLTTHYWEGRWLQEMEPLIPNLDEIRRKNGPVAVAKSWRRRMMLTPCCVSTFAMLPALMKVFRSNGSEYIADYLYNFIDLLIVDEAGQVLPEVAGASFALARRALVIGDTLQLDPIWVIPPHVDAGNLAHAKLIKVETAEQEYETIADLGKTAASGSVMRIAQGATRYHYDIDLARGMFLYEHRRCFDDIIEYSNRLCYHGKLLKKRPDRPIQGNLPPLGYLHIDGICSQNANHSRYNRLEAETIAAWISTHRDELEQKYGQPLAEILAVVTPFKGQVDMVARACRSQSIPVNNGENGITVGTVHSLQGAERRIVIFSPVYSKHADGGFIDKKVSMLNVAVSRAKDSFLVFGDMDIFELMPESKPRGLLAKFLFKRTEQTLQFEVRPRQDLTQDNKNPYPITDAAEHDAFLMAAVTKAIEEVHIVSPWLSLKRMKETGALNLLSEAAHRGVEIHIYTDYVLNEEQYGPGAIQRNRLKLLKAAELLAAEQISVHFVRQVHSKIVVCDQNLYCVGSFNWFSASRDDRYARFEQSLVYRGKHLVDEIRVLKDNLKKRVVFFDEHGGDPLCQGS
ncbi:AAA domain-containing protein [Paludibacterium yongneupense]|uniref:AAA domain-containing protein n=1 Tax=Paludibacterium yongneupense TaxID=400061 RepID=UPI000414601A|nr:AAA domain-containing protein [Paludibacterium yongneupense]